MKKYSEIIKISPLFKGINENEFESMLSCIGGRFRTYDKGETIIFIGNEMYDVGIVISGEVLVINEDFYGNRSIYMQMKEGESFGESYACAGIEKSPANVVTVTGCEVLFFDIKRSLTTCSSACVFHTRFIKNLLMLIACKNLHLNHKIEFLSKRTIREKLMAYLLEQAKENNSEEFEIRFDRNELADFLYIDRSAMSREMCKMRDDGLITFNKNKFKILNNKGM